MSAASTLGFEESIIGTGKHSGRHRRHHHLKPRVALEEYFVGPRDIARHSKWPKALRMHGSVSPKLIVPTIGVAIWAALVTTISEKVHHIHVNPIVIVVLGLVVGLALNFRDLIAKVTCLNMIIAFAVSLKHKLRFEPYIRYDDLNELAAHLNTFAKEAGEPDLVQKKVRTCKKIGEMLKVPMARSNPRKALKRAKKPLGNLPLEILAYIGAYVDEICKNGTFILGIAQTHALNNMQRLTEGLSWSDRILNTPMPPAYSITIAQITWIYIISMPFQLVHLMDWVCIPVTTFAAYIILAFHAIGNELENPFGPDVNDLPLELYCAQIASDITVIASRPRAKPTDHHKHPGNKPLFPISSAGSKFWIHRAVTEIRKALITRASICKGVLWRRQASYAGIEGSIRSMSSDASSSCPSCEDGACDTGECEDPLASSLTLRVKNFAPHGPVQSSECTGHGTG
ncbi:Bestrophin, RFP-TM, chloride channel-domain-containing protein [Lophiotrema nucula]|uniref:Bestrophin, RFP-TM, chloride channel-domain-containing protein n=1 Tax=Lophiotrema nucula TaxID=690887 RepID=A0A6A5ZKE7_9PLEO|nr:Bestrophin, RFP-TM, chloride channel-domain-containing protein [Lophiotrema nucula]